MTAELHAAGVRVLFPYNPWDTGTRREPLDDQRALVALLKQTGGDGANGDANPNPNPDPAPNPNPDPAPDPCPGDTVASIPKSFWTAALQESY